MVNPVMVNPVMVITASTNDNKLRVLNDVNFEQYLYQVVPSEMPASFGEEALKAQAVAARTYALNNLFSNHKIHFIFLCLY